MRLTLPTHFFVQFYRKTVAALSILYIHTYYVPIYLLHIHLNKQITSLFTNFDNKPPSFLST